MVTSDNDLTRPPSSWGCMNCNSSLHQSLIRMYAMHVIRSTQLVSIERMQIFTICNVKIYKLKNSLILHPFFMPRTSQLLTNRDWRVFREGSRSAAVGNLKCNKLQFIYNRAHVHCAIHSLVSWIIRALPSYFFLPLDAGLRRNPSKLIIFSGSNSISSSRPQKALLLIKFIRDSSSRNIVCIILFSFLVYRLWLKISWAAFQPKLKKTFTDLQRTNHTKWRKPSTSKGEKGNEGFDHLKRITFDFALLELFQVLPFSW